MTFGVVKTIMVCAPLATGPSVAPCADDAGISYAPQQVQAYVLEQASSPTVEAMLTSSTQPFDPATAGAFFEFGFAGVVSMWFLGKVCRSILKSMGLQI
jgi:hypothetical protein